MPTLAELMAKKKGAAPAAAAGAPVIRDGTADPVAAARAEIDGRPRPKRQDPAPEPRELGEMLPGERVPLDIPPEGAGEDALAWFSALHSFESEMGIVVEPGETAEHAWLAVRAQGQQRPILLLRLPLLNRPGGPF